MTEEKEAALRVIYQQWPVERLAHAATHEKGAYEAEAVSLMLDELKKRGIGSEELSKTAALVPPPMQVAERDTRMFPARLNRKQYAIRWFLWVIVFLLSGGLLSAIPVAGEVALILWLLAGLVYRIIALDIPRLKNAGMSPFLLFLALVPLVNIGLVVMLFATPPKK